jgi:hypothetical protein
MTRDDAKRTAEWAAAYDKALSNFHDRVMRKATIIKAFAAHDKPTCTISVKHNARDTYGTVREFDLGVPARMAQEWLMIDIAGQIDRARSAALRAGVPPELLVENVK